MFGKQGQEIRGPFNEAIGKRPVPVPNHAGITTDMRRRVLKEVGIFGNHRKVSAPGRTLLRIL